MNLVIHSSWSQGIRRQRFLRHNVTITHERVHFKSSTFFLNQKCSYTSVEQIMWSHLKQLILKSNTTQDDELMTHTKENRHHDQHISGILILAAKWHQISPAQFAAWAEIPFTCCQLSCNRNLNKHICVMPCGLCTMNGRFRK